MTINGRLKKVVTKACSDNTENSGCNCDCKKDVVEKTIDIEDIKINTVVFDTDIASDTILSLIEEIEQKDAHLTQIYFTSPGGTLHSMNIWNDYMERCERAFEIIIADLVGSAGLGIFLKACELDNCYVRLLQTGYGMAHKPTFTMDHRDLSNKRSYSYFMNKDCEATFDEWKDTHKELFELIPDSSQIIDDFDRGLDIYISNGILQKYSDIKEAIKQDRSNKITEENTIEN